MPAPQWDDCMELFATDLERPERLAEAGAEVHLTAETLSPTCQLGEEFAGAYAGDYKGARSRSAKNARRARRELKCKAKFLQQSALSTSRTTCALGRRWSMRWVAARCGTWSNPRDARELRLDLGTGTSGAPR